MHQEAVSVGLDDLRGLFCFFLPYVSVFEWSQWPRGSVSFSAVIVLLFHNVCLPLVLNAEADLAEFT